MYEVAVVKEGKKIVSVDAHILYENINVTLRDTIKDSVV